MSDACGKPSDTVTKDVEIKPVPAPVEKPVKQDAAAEAGKDTKKEEIHPGSIVDADVQQWQDAYAADPSKKALGVLLSKAPLTYLMADMTLKNANHHIFNTLISKEARTISDQESSGRCWMFASLNCARVAFMKKYAEIDDFQFSAGYLSFWDKLERSNGFLERMITLIEEPLESRVVQMFTGWAANDGGWAHESAGLIKKYGLVPKEIYHESYNTSNSSRLTELLSSKLREYCLELRHIWETARKDAEDEAEEKKDAWRSQALEACRKKKKEQLNEIYRMLSMLCGTSPKPTQKLRFDYYDKDKKHQILEKTPLEFYQALAPEFDVDDLVVLSHDPRYSMNRVYAAKHSASFVGQVTNKVLNVDIDKMNEMVVKMLKNDTPVWFACDVGKFMTMSGGLMDTKLYDYVSIFGTGLNMTKAQRIATSDSYPTHAMTIVGAHVEDSGRASRFRIENSWSKHVGKKGYFVCTRDWFADHAYIAVVSRKVLDSDMLHAIDKQTPIELAPWQWSAAPMTMTAGRDCKL